MSDSRHHHVRSVTTDDVDALVVLRDAIEDADRTEERYDADDVREELEDPALDLRTDWLVAEVDGALVAEQRLRPRSAEDGVQRLAVVGGAHPAHRGRGLSTELVGRVVARAHEYAAARGVRAAPYASAPDDVPHVTDLLGAHGLHPHRWTFVMRADLTGDLPDPPAVPDGSSLGTWEGVDPDEVRAAHNVAFVGHPGFAAWDAEMWQQWVTGSRHDRPAASLLLRGPDGEVAAYLQTQEYDADTAATGRREAFVAKVGTLPAHRRQGLAGLLLRHAMHRYAALGYVGAGLDVDSANPSGANSVYERAGFRVTRRWVDYEAGEA